MQFNRENLISKLLKEKEEKEEKEEEEEERQLVVAGGQTFGGSCFDGHSN